MRAKQLSLVAVTMWSLGLTVWGMQAPGAQAPGAPPATAPSGRGQAPAAPAAPSDPPAPFYPHIVASGLRGGYQVVAADMNKDGKIDLIGLGSSMTELIWYENPYWTPHVITRSAPRMINLSAMDVDGDGIPEIGLAYEFGTQPARSPGKIAILKSTKDPTALWTFKEIDALPTSHRVRFADIGGQKMLINAPILGEKSRDGFNDPDHTVTPLRAYRPPDWRPETITEENLGVVHGLYIGDWDGDVRQDVLTAGYSGVFAHSLGKNGTWTRTEIVKGDPAPWPQGGASDIAVGTLNKKKFFVTNEPFHGNQVVVYTDAGRGEWTRNVIDATLNNSHALVLVDADGDGNSEIVSAGTRGAPGTARGAKPGAFFYKAADPSGQKWNKMLLDAAIAANGCVTADINNDRRMDVICIDNSDPWNLKWYENTSEARK
jgi:hypothetical protein